MRLPGDQRPRGAAWWRASSTAAPLPSSAARAPPPSGVARPGCGVALFQMALRASTRVLVLDPDVRPGPAAADARPRRWAPAGAACSASPAGARSTMRPPRPHRRRRRRRATTTAERPRGPDATLGVIAPAAEVDAARRVVLRADHLHFYSASLSRCPPTAAAAGGTARADLADEPGVGAAARRCRRSSCPSPHDRHVGRPARRPAAANRAAPRLAPRWRGARRNDAPPPWRAAAAAAAAEPPAVARGGGPRGWCRRRRRRLGGSAAAVAAAARRPRRGGAPPLASHFATPPRSTSLEWSTLAAVARGRRRLRR